MKAKLFVFCLLLPLFPAVSSAGFVSETFNLTYSNELSDGVTYATVEVQYWDGLDDLLDNNPDDANGDGIADKTQVVITVTALADPYDNDSSNTNFGIKAFALNTLLTDVSGLTLDVQSGDPLSGADWNVSFNQNVSEYGWFEIYNSSSQNQDTETPVVFTISGLNPDGSESILDTFAVDNEGKHGTDYYYAAHIAGFSIDGSNLTSHWVAYAPGDFNPGGDPDPVPEPASILLFGLGTLGMGVIARRRQQKEDHELV